MNSLIKKDIFIITLSIIILLISGCTNNGNKKNKSGHTYSNYVQTGTYYTGGGANF